MGEGDLVRLTPEQADVIRQPGPVTPSPQRSYDQAVEVAVLGAQLVIAAHLDTDEAPNDLIMPTATIARDPEDQ